MTRPTPTTQTVVVTGGTGYLATWVIVRLLEQGYRVRTTVRALRRSDDVRQAVAAGLGRQAELSFVQADLLSDAGWADAMADADFVVHTASPMPVGEYRGQDLVRPAREGTRRVLTAAARAGVARTVLTSSTEAARPRVTTQTVDETVWSQLPDKPENRYARSKTMAEQEAWALVEQDPAGMELATILPASIQGPVLGPDYSGSVDLIRMMLSGKMPAVPNFGFAFVDARDLADLHVRAMTAPAAAGQRFLAVGDFLWFRDVAQLLRDNLGRDAAKVSTRRLPDVVVRLAGRVNPELAMIAAGLHRKVDIDAGKAERLLGWRTRPARQSLLDAARSLIERGIVAA